MTEGALVAQDKGAMYTPKTFLCDDLSTLHSLIVSYSFGTLIATMPDGTSEMTHLPFLLDATAGPMGTLRAHVARANPIAKAVEAHATMTAIFVGPHAYVSPRWYEEPTTQVPTWNYAAVHAYGVASGPMTNDELRSALRDLSTVHEGGVEGAWSIDVLAPDLVDKHLAALCGFSIPIDRIDGKTKLSQNRSIEDHARVVAALDARNGPDDRATAALMKRIGRAKDGD